jgi:DNA-binding NarL/FixJ family response regulator
VIQNLFEDVENVFHDVEPSGQNPYGHGQQRRFEYNLTRREHEILALLPEGRSNRSIAQNLFLSEKTVKAHLAAIFRKLGVTNRTQAAMMAVQMGVGAAESGRRGTGQE